MRPIIVLNDPSVKGGRVLQGSPSTFLHGFNVARLGDRVLCIHGPCAIDQGDETLLVDDRPVARQGDRLVCGDTLVATHDDCFIL
jgi:uncharacterized Zn-binding protein involved in type VI secretion